MKIFRFLPVVAITLAMPTGSRAQTQLDLRTQAKSVDFSNAISTRPFKTGTSLPATCVVGEAFFKTNAAAGQNWFGCSSTNNWSQQSGSGGGSGSGPNAYTVVTFSSTPAFTVSGNHATTFLLLLVGSVNSSSLSGVSAGDLLMFRICQDGAGGHTFIWPANVQGAGPISAAANACTSQSFVFDGNNALAISAVTMTGVSGGVITMPGGTSGATTIQPAAAAGGTLTLPARTATIATTLGTSTANNCARFDASGNLVDSGAACGGGSGGAGSQQHWFPAATCGYGLAMASTWDMDNFNPNGLLCSYLLTGGPAFGVMEFSNTSDGYAWLTVPLPSSFNSVNVTLKAWRGGSSTGDTRYVLDGRCMADGDTGSSTYPNSAAVIKAAAVSYSLQTYSFTNFPTAGCAGGNLLVLQLHRDHTCTGCTNGNMASTSYFKGAEVDIQ